MGTRERRAILLLLLVAVAGHTVRWWLGRRDAGSVAPGAISILSPATAGEPGARRDRVEELVRPLGEGERVNLDEAPAEELERLPRVGPALARAIVADRERNGPFGGLEGLQRVPGIGRGLARALEAHATFSPGRGRTVAGTGSGTAGRGGPVDLNRATRQELQALPGIGPTRAAAIVAYREVHGPFATLAAVAEVPGIGAATLARLEALVRVP